MNFDFSEIFKLQISSHPYMCVEKILGCRNRPKSKLESANGVSTKTRLFRSKTTVFIKTFEKMLKNINKDIVQLENSEKSLF